MMNNNSKKMILSLFILMTGVLFLVGGVSYAWFNFQANGEKSSSITTNGITFSYKEGARTIGLNEAMPMTDSEGMNQNNYFEFDITSSGVKDSFQIPYDIALKKINNSSNIDDAIKVGLTEAIYNENDVYGITNTYKTIGEYNVDYLPQRPTVEFSITKLYSQGDIVDKDLYSQYYYSVSYDTKDQCLESEHYLNTMFYNSDCVEKDGKYVVEIYIQLYNSEKECLDDSESSSCVKKYSAGDTYEHDVYDIVAWYQINDAFNYTLEDCNNNIPQYDNIQCKLRYPSGITEKEIGIFKYNELNNYLNKLTNTQNEKLLFQDQVSTDNYKKTFRLRMWIDYNTDFTQSKYNNANFGLNVNVYGEGKEK